jgi:hypothetical protein
VLDPDDLQIARTAEEIAEHARREHPTGSVENDEPKPGPWDMLRTPLLTGLVVLVVALGAIEPEVGTIKLLAPALAAALPAFARVLSAMSGVVGR